MVAGNWRFQLHSVRCLGSNRVAKQVPAFALTVTSAGQVIVGGCVSLTVTVKVHWLLLPLLSVAVLVTVVTPTGKAEPLAGTLTRLVTEPHRSLAVTLKVTLLAHEPEAALTVMFAGQVMVGG